MPRGARLATVVAGALTVVVAIGLLRGAEGGPAVPAAPPGSVPAPHPVVVRAGRPAPRVAVGDETVACGTCHATRPANAGNRATADLDLFHQGLQVAHGSNSCLSCHDARDYDRLRLADGTPVAFDRVAVLCAQCHGPQERDYQAGAHGGMTGHWDLQRGGRERQSCTACHDPHTPAYQAVHPLPPPRDRFQTGAVHE